MKVFFSVLLTISLLFFTISFPILAEENSTISAKLQSGGSYELFWPLTSGNTMDNPFYFLKLWKEDVSGWFIFDTAKKADYEVTLATKRVLEAEKLLHEKKENLAGKTLDKALTQLTLSRGIFSKASRSENNFSLARVNINNQLSNLQVFIPRMSELGQGSSRTQSEKIKDIVEKFLHDVRNP